ncbi:MAG: spore germination protein, partial [Thermoanaerobacteraceae bacterium]|nr:spore germination protein [Thermoanaerobacteraceae bacterium]
MVNNTIIDQRIVRMVKLFKWLKKLHRILISSSLKQTLEQNTPQKQNPLSSDLRENLAKIKEVFSNASDIVIRQFEIGSQIRIKAFIVYVDGLVDREFVQMNLMKPLMIDMHLSKVDDEFNHKNALNIIYQRILTLSEVKEAKDFKDTI